MLRIGCVPYLNAKPLIDWFHDSSCDVAAIVTYAPPAELAQQLAAGELDTALVSTFELFRTPNLVVLPGMSVSATGRVRSVRLFSNLSFNDVQTVGVDSGSLTSVALTRIVLKEEFSVNPEIVSLVPSVSLMLERCDAGLIIGELGGFNPAPTNIIDLGEAWMTLTGLPFCYAAWLCHSEFDTGELTAALLRAKNWGVKRTEELAHKWASRMGISPERAVEYLCSTIEFDLTEQHVAGLHEFQMRCLLHGIIKQPLPISILKGD